MTLADPPPYHGIFHNGFFLNPSLSHNPTGVLNPLEMERGDFKATFVVENTPIFRSYCSFLVVS